MSSIQRLLASVSEDFADRVLREHSGWRFGIVPMGRMKLALHLYAMSE
ncbi:hypothetical protein [Microbacterium sp. MEJ108Y]|nr:hypothetical protein [Microbacterium sp. MEJ108Y]